MAADEVHQLPRAGVAGYREGQPGAAAAPKHACLNKLSPVLEF
jgi:hypothetical protein